MNENQNPVSEVAKIADETVAALTADYLNSEYPNVVFEAVETGGKYYQLNVWAKYPDKFGYPQAVHPHTLKQFTKEAYKVIQVIAHTLIVEGREGMLR